MKTVFAGLLFFALAATAGASSMNGNNSTVRWRTVVGVITAQNVDNPICGTDSQGRCVGTTIDSGTFAWSARSGSARVNLATGDTTFRVNGLVINGTSFSGTAGPITQIEGTLVCNLGAAGEAVLDTDPVALSGRGDASFSGQIDDVPTPCNSPLFLFRIVSPSVARGRWIATGADLASPAGGGDY